MVQAVVSWWILQLDREGTIFYSTAPKWIGSPMNMSTGNWCDHWKQCVWFLPGKGIRVGKGEQLLFRANHTNISVFYNISSPDTMVRYTSSDGNFHLVLPPERIAIYGDGKWRSSVVKALRNMLPDKIQPLCVVADDSLFATLVIPHLSKTAHIISLFPGLREKGAQYLQMVADANGFSANHVNVFLNNKCLTLKDTNQKKVDILIAEPYYYGNDGTLPWQNLQFWKTRTLLDSILSDDFLIMPCKARLKACAMFLPDLWNSRRSLSKIEGFDHSVANTILGACGKLPPLHEGPILPVFIWQSGEVKELSERFTLMEFEFSKLISPCCGKIQVEFVEPGMCHGFAIWIDWVMDAKNSIVLSTGPDQRFWKQGVKLLREPVSVDYCCSAVIEASFDPLTSELRVSHAFT